MLIKLWGGSKISETLQRKSKLITMQFSLFSVNEGESDVKKQQAVLQRAESCLCQTHGAALPFPQQCTATQSYVLLTRGKETLRNTT